MGAARARSPTSTPPPCPRATRCNASSGSSPAPTSPRSAGSGSSTTTSSRATRCKRPGGDAAIVRIGDSGKALALCTDATARYCRADPARGGAQAVAESWRNLTAVGALPLALTDNMNFGNPEKPEIMGEFAGAIEGMRAACLALDYPVVSGNVSLYNETSGSAILPTPVIGGVGLVADARRAVDLALKRDGNALILIGDTAGHLGASLYLREIEGREDGPPPPVDLAAERRNGDFVRRLIEQGLAAACHDLSDGGLLVALAEMAMAGGRGVALDPLPADAPVNAFLFGEDQARYLIETADATTVLAAAGVAGVPARRIGYGLWRRVDTPRCRCHIGRATHSRKRGLAAGLYGATLTPGQIVEARSMAMDAATIEQLIKQSLPDAQVSIEDLRGDGDHYAAHVVSSAFRGKTRIQQHQLVYQALRGRMGNELHALALQTGTPED